VNVLAAVVTAMLAPANVFAPVPPLAIANVPVTPVDNGRPVQLVSVPDVGVPNSGVTSVGLVDKTTLPVPVEVVTPVPPLATFNVPARVTTPLVAVEGVKPVVPAENVVTGADVELCANSVTTPELFLKYNLPSVMLSASSPLTRLVFTGTAAAVVL
jgi:hypothetical protein